MRVALCLYGQPRAIGQKWESIKSNLVDPNNCDLFFHSWYDPNNLQMNKMTPGHEARQFEPGLESSLITALDPKAYIIEQQKSFTIKDWHISEETFQACWPWATCYDRKTFENDRIFAWQSMWYSIHKSIQLKEEYSNENGFEYDCVIVMRFDVSPTSPLDVSSFDMQYFHTHDERPRDELSDWFMFSSSSNMNIAGSTYYMLNHHVKKMVEQNKITTNEGFLREQLSLFDIPVRNCKAEITF